MDKNQVENLCQLTAHMAERRGSITPTYAALTAIEIHGHARALSKLAEAECNTGLTKRQQAREEVLQKRIAVLLKTYGLRATFSGDPRGYVVKIVGLPGNTWGGDSEGFGVG